MIFTSIIMKYILLISCLAFLVSSSLAAKTKKDLLKEIGGLRRILAGEVKKSEAMEKEIADGIFGGLGRLHAQSVKSLDLIKDTNATELSIWRARANFANVSIWECLVNLEDLWVTRRDIEDEMRILINDEASLQIRINRELSEAINATILDEMILLEEKVNKCQDNDDFCLEEIDTRIKSDWEKLPAVISNGLKTEVQWFSDNQILPSVRALVKKFKSHTQIVLNTIVTCIKEKLNE